MSESDKQPLWLGFTIACRQTRSARADCLLLGARLYAGIITASAGLDRLPTPDWMVEQVIQMKLFPDPANMRADIPNPGDYFFSVDQETYTYELKAAE